MTKLIVIDHDWRRVKLIVALSDCWMRNGKPVRFEFRRFYAERNPNIHAYSFIFLFLSIKFGWL